MAPSSTPSGHSGEQRQCSNISDSKDKSTVIKYFSSHVVGKVLYNLGHAAQCRFLFQFSETHFKKLQKIIIIQKQLPQFKTSQHSHTISVDVTSETYFKVRCT